MTVRGTSPAWKTLLLRRFTGDTTTWLIYSVAAVTITVSTVYGDIEGARKGHNTKHRGKKGLRPALCFVAETREYLCGTQRRGQAMKNGEGASSVSQTAARVREGYPDAWRWRIHRLRECKSL
jgi:hypothetical protein